MATTQTAEDSEEPTENSETPPVAIDHVTVVPVNYDPETGEITDE